MLDAHKFHQWNMDLEVSFLYKIIVSILGWLNFPTLKTSLFVVKTFTIF